MRLLVIFLLAASLFGEETVTTHLLELKSGPLSYTATVGQMPVLDAEKKEVGKIGYISYILDGSQKKRPITFAFNGGPGSSSTWLHLGMFGPKRVVSPEEGGRISPPYELVDSEETLLDLTDLVFIDPIGTGLSEASSENAQAFFDTTKDIESIGGCIRDYLTKNQRWNGEIYLAGESYGTLRACGLCNYLQEEGIYISGVILISCAIDFQTLIPYGGNFLPSLLAFPTYTLTAWHHGRYRPEASLEEVKEEAKRFTYDTYLPYLFRSNIPFSEKKSLFEKISAMTGLPLVVVEKEQGKIDDFSFLTEFFPGEKKVLGIYDTRCTGDSLHPRAWKQDPSVAAIQGIFTTSLHAYLQKDLGCPQNYQIFSETANRSWKFTTSNWGGYPSFMDDLRLSLIVNPSLKVFVGSGYFDMATPFAATDYCFDKIGKNHLERIEMKYYEGGHMYYLSPNSRKQFKQDLIHYFQNRL